MWLQPPLQLLRLTWPTLDVGTVSALPPLAEDPG